MRRRILSFAEDQSYQALLAALRHLRAQQISGTSALGSAGYSDSFEPLKRPKTYALPASFAGLPPGQRRVAEALVGGDVAPTYAEVADALGLHVGTVLGYLNRIRQRRPDAYADLMALRRRQLGERHRAALRRAAEHSRRWHRKQANRRYYCRFGRWPWERSR